MYRKTRTTAHHATFPRKQVPGPGGRGTGRGRPIRRAARHSPRVRSPAGRRPSGSPRRPTAPDTPGSVPAPPSRRRQEAPRAFPPFPAPPPGPGGSAGAALRGGGGGDGAAIVPQPLPGAQDGLAGYPGGAAGGRGVREPVRFGAARLSPRATAPRPSPQPPAVRAAFVTVSSPSEPARRRRCARGCKWRPLASVPPTARPAGDVWALRPGPHPAAAARASPVARFASRSRQPRRPAALRPPPAPPAPPAGSYRGPRRTGVSRAQAGGDSRSSAGETLPFEAVPLRPKTSSPNVRETKGIC